MVSTAMHTGLTAAKFILPDGKRMMAYHILGESQALVPLMLSVELAEPIHTQSSHLPVSHCMRVMAGECERCYHGPRTYLKCKE